jgi:hypothetical protein
MHQRRCGLHETGWPISTAVPCPLRIMPHLSMRMGSRGGGLTQLGAVSTDRKAELILREVKHVDGVDVNIKLENLGGSRRRISGELSAKALCTACLMPKHGAAVAVRSREVAYL